MKEAFKEMFGGLSRKGLYGLYGPGSCFGSGVGTADVIDGDVIGSGGAGYALFGWTFFGAFTPVFNTFGEAAITLFWYAKTKNQNTQKKNPYRKRNGENDALWVHTVEARAILAKSRMKSGKVKKSGVGESRG